MTGSRLHSLPVGLLTLLFALPPSLAQVAEVVAADEQGDFRTLSIPAARGRYLQRFWLIVDQDPRGLLCRNSQGRALIALRRGAIVETASQEKEPLILQQTKPYLLVRVNGRDLLHDVRHRERGLPTTCRIRANSSFIAPVLEDALLELKP